MSGIKIKEPSVDLAILIAIFSSFKNLILKKKSVLIGEIGLSGEVRRVKNICQRINEAQKFDFDLVVIPVKNAPELIDNMYNNVENVSNIKEAINILFD